VMLDDSQQPAMSDPPTEEPGLVRSG
jgi:hypothetical protein